VGLVDVLDVPVGAPYDERAVDLAHGAARGQCTAPLEVAHAAAVRRVTPTTLRARLERLARVIRDEEGDALGAAVDEAVAMAAPRSDSVSM